MLVPDSTVVTGAASAGSLEWVQALESHINGTSSKFNIGNSVSSGGDYGIEINPTAASWNAAVYHYDTNNEIRAYLDPNGQITNPVDPSNGGDGSSATSPVGGWWIQSASDMFYTPDTEFLVAELDEVLLMIIKEGSNSFIRDYGQLGKIFQPALVGDGSQGLDGLGVTGETGELDNTNNSQSQYKYDAENWAVCKQDNRQTISGQLPNGRQRPSLIKVRGTNNDHIYGTYRTYYGWDGNTNSLTRVEDSNGTGGILIGENGNWGLMWDPNVNPL